MMGEGMVAGVGAVGWLFAAGAVLWALMERADRDCRAGLDEDHADALADRALDALDDLAAARAEIARLRAELDEEKAGNARLRDVLSAALRAPVTVQEAS